jgi:hypothetical protein
MSDAPDTAVPASGGDVRILGLIVCDDFSVQIGPSLLHFSAGQRVTDPILVMALIECGCPVTEIIDWQDVCTCPFCRRSMSVRMLAAAEAE